MTTLFICFVVLLLVFMGGIIALERLVHGGEA